MGEGTPCRMRRELLADLGEDTRTGVDVKPTPGA